MRLRVAYDGGAFSGWQRQQGLRTVQGLLDETVRHMDEMASLVRGASRTDAGVHAEGQVAAFDFTRSIPERGWLRGLNRYLPKDVSVTEAVDVPPGYDPRFDAVHKRYRYLIELGDVPHPMLRHMVWYLGPSRGGDRLDLPAMERAAARFVGEHDFRAFQGQGDQRANTVRRILSVSVLPRAFACEKLLAVEVVGEAFVKQMVRNMVGTLVEVAQGRRPEEDIKRLLSERLHRREAGQTAPACGLSLVHVQLGRNRELGPYKP